MKKSIKLTAILAILLISTTIVFDCLWPSLIGMGMLTSLFVTNKEFRRVF